MKTIWRGVIPAITTPFHEDFSIDHAFFAKHCQWLIDNGCSGIVALGSLGEGATLSMDEKRALLHTAVKAIGNRVPVIAGVSALSTHEAVAIARMAEDAGCQGLMVLPPYVYIGDWREMKAHASAILEATPLSAMLYNTPVAYTTDFLPHQVSELLEQHANLHAIKESSADVRRVAALRAAAGDRLQILCGVDDLIVEAVAMGATGWIAGLVNAFPRESVDLFATGDWELYKWFLPLLRMDTVPKFVQLIKLVQQEVGMGHERVRAPRLTIAGSEREQALATIQAALTSRRLAARS
jgi:dihydrodipicolinate synthase/N-acetylneuraminate lyase